MSTPTPTPAPPDFSDTNLARIQAIADPTARNAAFQALENTINANLATANAALTSNALSAPQFLAKLAALDVSSPPAVREFTSTTQLGTVAPVPLGSHAGVSYFLDPNTATVPIRDDPNGTLLDAGLPHSNCIVAYRRYPIPGAAMPGIPEIKYGFGLGRLMYLASGATATAAADLLDAGFFVLLNALDKSVWIVVDYFGWSDLGERAEAPETNWGHVPGDDGLQIGAMQISRYAWQTGTAPSLAGGDPLGLFPALGCRLEGSMASMARWEAAYAAVAATTNGNVGH